ncbi:MAG: type I-C CRISPR-associated protein Cas5 [Chloroflexia bacterium]|nr:type I-C CRISPR-associated protein Cas5 [Chloroflexia bacterium]
MAFESPLEVKVWGDLACFTRPEMKVERVSYPVMTPSAARGVLESIFWKPEFHWRVDEIWVLNDIRYTSFMRNEITTRVSERTARGWAEHGGGYLADEDRTQRHTLALRDVVYVIRAQAVPKSGAEADAAKYRDQFRRRLHRGQAHSMPYLGCREFAASFAPVAGSERPVQRTEDLGRMLLALDYSPERDGHATPRFFDARLNDGVLRVPHHEARG